MVIIGCDGETQQEERRIHCGWIDHKELQVIGAALPRPDYPGSTRDLVPSK